LSKKKILLQIATSLFARKGFHATTTKEIAAGAGVTEPVIYNNFRNKDHLFATIIKDTFEEYFKRLEGIEEKTPTQFEKIKELINLHFRFLNDFPDETYIIVSACPDMLRETGHICTSLVDEQKGRLVKFITACLEEGMRTGEFRNVDVPATGVLMVAMLNGLMRRRGLRLDEVDGLREGTVIFCKRSLVKVQLNIE